MSIKNIKALIDAAGDIDDLTRCDLAEKARVEAATLLEVIGLVYYSQSMTVTGGDVVVNLTADTMERIRQTYEGTTK